MPAGRKCDVFNLVIVQINGSFWLTEMFNTGTLGLGQLLGLITLEDVGGFVHEPLIVNCHSTVLRAARLLECMNT